LGVHKGIAFLVGTIAPIIVNWMLWPFVARHELRGALSSMIYYMSIMYRSKFCPALQTTPLTVKMSLQTTSTSMREKIQLLKTYGGPRCLKVECEKVSSESGSSSS
jgi:hypothetical protein